ncbi:MAG: BMP family protein, partial [Halanaerobiales bacterium]
MLKKVAVVLTLILVLSFVVSENILAEEDFKAALLVSGNVDDEGWNQSAYEGLVLIEEKYGWDIAYTETVGQAEQYDIMRSYANQGFDLIIGHGFQYEDALKRAAEQYPDVYFLQIGGFAENGDNLSSAVFTEGHSGYLPGILAAGMTESNKVGLIGAEALPTITTEFAAMQNAIKKYNEEAEIMESYVGSMVDVGAARETAIAQINQGVDIIVPIG